MKLTFGGIIKRYRRQNHRMTQKSLAGILGVTEGTISMWEHNKGKPRSGAIIDRLQNLIPELRGRKDLRNGSVRLRESVEDERRRPPENALFSTLWDFAYEHPDLLELKYEQDQVIFTLKLPGSHKA